MNLYFINKSPYWWKEETAFMGGQGCEDIWIMAGMPFLMTVFVIFHEFFHWLEWKMPWRYLNDGLHWATVKVRCRLWEKYEWFSGLVARRWRRRCRNV